MAALTECSSLAVKSNSSDASAELLCTPSIHCPQLATASQLAVNYWRTFLDTLLRDGEDEAEWVREEYHEADARTQQEYGIQAATVGR